VSPNEEGPTPRPIATGPAWNPLPLPSPHTRVGVGGVLIREGRVLVNRAIYRNRFTIPSGYVDPGETLETALCREFEEESGVRVRVGRLILTRHKVVTELESDVYFAFALEHESGEPTARPPEIAEIREPLLDEAVAAPWISELSRLAIELAGDPGTTWPRSAWKGGEAPGRASEAYHSEGP
jgi:ADP-ribose pyrophosphatase YjhB (NUDIX family)